MATVKKWAAKIDPIDNEVTTIQADFIVDGDDLILDAGQPAMKYVLGNARVFTILTTNTLFDTELGAIASLEADADNSLTRQQLRATAAAERKSSIMAKKVTAEAKA